MMKLCTDVQRLGRGALVIVIAAAAVTSPAWAVYDLSWFTIDGGGGASAAGGYAIVGVAGQPDAGLMAGGVYSLAGGFWSGGAASGTAVPAGAAGGATADAPRYFVLYEPAPSPFAQNVFASTVIAFDVPEPRPMRLAIFDAEGRCVRILVRGSLPAGRYQRAWDGKDEDGRVVASGIYFLRLDAGTTVARQKVVLIR